MKRILALFTATILLFCSSACAGEGSSSQKKHNDMIISAVEELKAHWQEIYNETAPDTDRYFEIKNTRVITIKKNDIKPFKDMAYLIEFVLYTDYLGTSPYYEDVNVANSVIVYKSGYMEVANTNPIKSYRSITFNTDVTGYVKEIDDYHNEYNCTEYL